MRPSLPVRQRSAARAARERSSRAWRGSTTFRTPRAGAGCGVDARGKARVGDGEARRVIENGDVAIEGRRPERTFRLAPLTHFVIGDELRLRFLDLHEAAEFGGLRQLALADDLGVRLEEADHLAGEVEIAADNARRAVLPHA